MLKRLDELELVRYEPYHGVTLTPAGERVALEVIRHHRLIESFLAESLEMPWDRVHDEAEVLEHYISEELEDRIAEKLGNPELDPHGDPIPTSELDLATDRTVALAELGGARSRRSPGSPTRTRTCCATWPSAGSAPASGFGSLAPSRSGARSGRGREAASMPSAASWPTRCVSSWRSGE